MATPASAEKATGTSAIGTRSIVCVLAMAVLGGAIPALQPILLAALNGEGRITADQIGQIATAEALGMAIGATLAAALLRPRGLRWMTAGAMFVIAATNALTVTLDATGILAVRVASGAAAGLVLWVLVGLMTRAANPGRIFAIYVTVQGVVSFLLSLLLTQFVLPHHGVGGGYTMLAVLAVLLIGAALAGPAAFAEEEGAARLALPPLSGLLGLLCVACFLGGLFAFWVYVPLVAAERGHDAATIGRAISAGMVGQVIGGLLAVWVSGKVGNALVTIASAIALAVLVLSIGFSASSAVLFGAVFLFNLVWMFAPPFQLPLLMHLDTSNRAAMFISPAQLVGVAVGPSVAAAALGMGGMGPVFAALGLLAASIVVLALASAVRSRSAKG